MLERKAATLSGGELNHLDIKKREAVEEALEDFAGALPPEPDFPPGRCLAAMRYSLKKGNGAHNPGWILNHRSASAVSKSDYYHQEGSLIAIESLGVSRNLPGGEFSKAKVLTA